MKFNRFDFDVSNLKETNKQETTAKKQLIQTIVIYVRVVKRNRNNAEIGSITIIKQSTKSKKRERLNQTNSKQQMKPCKQATEQN